MSYVLADLVVESILRDGLSVIRRTAAAVIPDVFGDMKQSWLSTKYGDREINKIIDFVSGKREISIVHAFNQVPANLPCISIQLLDNPEDESKAHLEDFEAEVIEEMTDPADLAGLAIVASCSVISYDPLSGILRVPDGVDLTNVSSGNIFVDFAGTEFGIRGPVVNLPGLKQFILEKQLIVNTMGPGEIKSQLNYTQTEQRGVVEKERLILGVHTQEPLLTKYLYTLVKYIIVSRRVDLINRGFQISSHSGSDFTKNLEYPSNMVFSRFITLTGTVQNSFTSDKVEPITAIDTIVKVEKDQGTTQELGLTDATVQVQDD